ncbi:MAG: glutamate-5-semialdehyde dehydrogenase [Firmicutes bacterium]|nr:glutamate-5-semialdehyde dehydrogenase [Bacillota bacterium]
MEAVIKEYAHRAKQAASALALLSPEVKNQALHGLAEALRDSRNEILLANQKDIAAAVKGGEPESRLDRLRLSEARIEEMAHGLQMIAKLDDPVGVVDDVRIQHNGLVIEKTRVPFGVVAVIYESRPNVTVDAAALAFKTGNAVLLRGGKEARHSNEAITNVMRATFQSLHLPVDAIQLISVLDREVVDQLIQARGYIDLVIPRGGAALIERVVQGARVPVIETGVGNCHVYVDATADQAMAEEIVVNAKTQRPSVCNAIETILLHESLDPSFVRRLLSRLLSCGVEVRACEQTLLRLGEEEQTAISLATDDDFATEFLDLIVAVKVVRDLDEALGHIERFGTKHSEAIVTNDAASAQTFLSRVDAAVVYHNASTRFTDGFEFGFGAEIGISTQKLHARGPMGLRELTTYKYVVKGSGQVRG